MTLVKRIKDKIECAFYPCQKQLNALTAEYNNSLQQLGEQVDNARSTISVRKIAAHNPQN